jgi:hypothetical protein
MHAGVSFGRLDCCVPLDSKTSRASQLVADRRITVAEVARTIAGPPCTRPAGGSVNCSLGNLVEIAALASARPITSRQAVVRPPLSPRAVAAARPDLGPARRWTAGM